MPEFHTKAFDAQDVLTALLTSALAGTAWTVDYGLPPRREEQHIWVDESIKPWKQDPYTEGLESKIETFTLHVAIYSKRTCSSALETRAEIKAAADVIASAIASDQFLGGVVMYASITGADYDSAFADAEGQSREGLMELDISCEAFLG